jgi:hypothetical protein
MTKRKTTSEVVAELKDQLAQLLQAQRDLLNELKRHRAS